MRADASYLRARAAADNNPELLRIAATISAGARQAERDAWEIRRARGRTRKTRGTELIMHGGAWLLFQNPAVRRLNKRHANGDWSGTWSDDQTHPNGGGVPGL